MSDMSFAWRGESSDAHGVVVRNLPPISTPPKRDQSIPIPGRSGSLHIQDGAYDEQLMMIEGYLPYEQGGYVSPIETIKAWLTGNGYLTLSDQPDRRFRARITDPVAFSPWMVGFADRIFSVSFWADPFAYEAIPTVRTLYGAFVFANPSTVPADPYITVHGKGQVTLRVGDISVTLDNMAGPVTIDCDTKTAFLGTTDVPGVYGGLIGAPTAITLNDERWPVLGEGNTRIEWSGNVTQVVVTPNWRWL